MRMPTSKSGGARFRGPTSSHEYNTNEDQKYLELVELYKQANETLRDLKEAHQIVLTENVTLNNYVNMLEDRVTDLEGKISSLDSTSWMNGKFYNTSFVQNMTTQYPGEFQDNQVTTPRCQINLQHRFATIPLIHQIPKTHVTNEQGDYIIPSELKVKVGRSSQSGEVIDNNLLNAFNGDDQSFWQRTVVYDSLNEIPSDGEDVIVEIELPTHLVHNLNINTIALHPHPERGVQIKNIEMHYKNSWQTIHGFQQNEITSLQTDDHSPRRTWYFPSVPVQRIRITLAQKHGMNIGGKTVFTLGAQEIGIYLSMFEPSGGMVLTPFNMDGTYNIESVEHVFLNRKSLSYPENMDHMLHSNIVEHFLYTEETDGTLRPLLQEEWDMQTATRIWVKTHLHSDPNNGVNPCLHAVRLHYTKH